jgi:hypothetical protein
MIDALVNLEFPKPVLIDALVQDSVRFQSLQQSIADHTLVHMHHQIVLYDISRQRQLVPN